MGFLRQLFTGQPDPVLSAPTNPGPTFAIDPEAIPAQVFGLESYSSPIAPAPRVSRREAIQVPAVKRSREIIAVTLGTLPLNLLDQQSQVTDWSLFTQPEPDVPRSVTLTKTFEDMLFEGVAWWKVETLGWHGRPVSIRRLDPRSITVKQDQKVYRTVKGNYGTVSEWLPDEQLIRFDGPSDALLVAGARAIRACLTLDAAALRHAEGAPPLDYFTPADDADPADDDEIVEILTQWKESRQARSTGYVPAALKYNIGGWEPEKLQLAEARQHAVLEIARLAGISPEYLGVSTTSRTYQNAQDERRFLLDFTLNGFLRAFEDRLSMDDVSPRGFRARMNLSEFLRSDDKSRMEIAKSGLEGRVLSGPEARRFFDPSLPVDTEVPEVENAPVEQPQEAAADV